MNVKELLYEADLYKYSSLVLLIEFLVIEKETVKLTDDISVLDLYFKPNNKEKMNKLLKEYMKNGGM